MGHGGYGKRRAAAAERKKPAGQRRPKALTIDKKSKANKPKSVSLKNQIRSIERMLRKELPHEVKEAQEKKLDELKKQQEIHNRLALERKIFLRNRKIKFFERRKIERRIRRLEKQQRASTGQAQEAEIAEQLTKLKEDLEYVRFFPKTEKYVSLFMGGDEAEIVEKRNNLRKQIKANLIAAAASGKDLEETGSEDDGLLDPSEDDFFLNGSSSDDADADDEWSARYLSQLPVKDQASSASGKAASGMSSDERNQRQISARALMPPPGPSGKPFSSSAKNKSRFAGSSSKKSYNRAEISTSSNTSSSIGRSSFRKRGPMDSTTGNSGNLSSNSDARKPRRKRRPKKKKQQTS
ncbi:rRNA-processing protein EFG1 isoform X1 [Sesamum indicum]|uniref:rRNA-processing protein EFG1 n=1 Tax=Sesamum indicum TaxID=4182 RepID=A0A6I9T058_SESIN|nr:rRNA-processing protein EFG1 isoform X1 [Sesamum indicum]